MARDFLTSQIRTSQIIASRSLSPGPSLVIISASNADGLGSITPTLGAGSDTFLFITGSRGSDAFTVFGGSVKISGSLTVFDNVILGQSAVDIIDFSGRVGSNIVPNTNESYDLGSPALKWDQIYARSGSFKYLESTENAIFSSGLTGSLQQVSDGSPYLVAGTNVSLSTASNGSITISATGGGGGGSSYFTDPSAGKLNTTGSLALAGQKGTSYITDNVGSDVFFFVSGSGGSRGSSTRGVSVFGGDVSITGSFAQGRTVVTTGLFSHAQGWNSIAAGNYSHAEGTSSSPGAYSHAEGVDTVSSGTAAHSAGDRTEASGDYSHAEGQLTIAAGDASHAEGNQSRAIGNYSHAEGLLTVASGAYSHAIGLQTIASGSGQAVFGKFNKRSNDTSLFIIGDGTGSPDSQRGDIFRVNSGSTPGSGNIEAIGSFFVEDVSGNTQIAATTAGVLSASSNILGGGNITVAGNATVRGGLITLTDVSGNGILEQTPSGDLELRNLTSGGDFFGSIRTTGGNTVNFLYVTSSTAASEVTVAIMPSIYPAAANPFLSSDTNFFVGGAPSSKGGATKGTAVFGGDVMISGSVYLGRTGADTVNFRSDLGTNIIPDVDMLRNLGSPSRRFANVYTGDLHLRNDRGDYTLIEEEDCLTIRFNKTGKRYKFVLEPAPEFD